MKTYFDEEIGPVPPSTIDLDQTIARQRRRNTYRRIGFSATGGLATVAAVAMLVTLTPARSEPNNLSAGSAASASQPGTSTAAEPSPSASAGPGTPGKPGTTTQNGKPTTEDPKQAEVRLAQAMLSLVRQQAPGAQISAKDGSDQPFNTTHRTSPGQSTPTGFDGAATLTDAQGKGNVFFGFTRVGNLVSGCDGVQGGFCEVATGPRRESITKMTATTDRIAENTVTIVKTDGTALLIGAGNYGDSSRCSACGPVTRPTPVLTFDQLVAIGTDLRMTLYP